MQQRLRITVVERDRDRALQVVDALKEAGDYEVSVLGDVTGLARKLAALDPDVVLIDIANPSRDTLEEMALASSPMERAVAMFVDRSDDALTTAAIEAGISAYVVDGLRPERIKPVLDAAIARFKMVSRMRRELEETKAALAERKMVDRAKGLLMAAKGISEGEAYTLLRRAAMDQGKKIGEVAAALVTASELLK
ncbi:ANTAR domain-containing protein [Limibaculum sp. M0105]|uniref:ANTAR domain-containing protein n=1 Tax=Thermohalobaculum xanthum TaxID=2753746 RepID=A0A8J7M4N5_9RHOB|nr:ANTAR domain-containing protein [Thermohalobaculum xanthum]MBK0398208.1 ANTAR domain-containing protein [Thermohalobaculum xanthum]